MSGNNYTEKEIYQMLFNHEITKEMALDLLSAAPQRTVAGTVPTKSHVHIMEEASNKAYQLEDILAEINEIVAGNLHMSEEELEHEMSFKDLGVDSINGIEIIRDVNRHYGLNLDAVVIYDHANITKLSELVLKEMNKNHLTLAQTGVNTPYKEKARKEYTGDRNSGEAGIEEEEVYSKISDIISSNLHLPKEELRYEVSFKELGVDSINGIEIIRDVNKSFGLSLDAVIIYDYSTISKLADYVIEEKNRTAKTLKEINPAANEPGGFLSEYQSNNGNSLDKNGNVRVKLGSVETTHKKADDFKTDGNKFINIPDDSIIRESTILESNKQYKINEAISKPGMIKLSDIKPGNKTPDYISHINKQDNTKQENNKSEVTKLTPIQLTSTEHAKNIISMEVKSSNMNSIVLNSTSKNSTGINNSQNSRKINFTSRNSTGSDSTSINSKNTNIIDNYSIINDKDRMDLPAVKLASREENQNQLHLYKEEDIAVIGISGRFPGAENVEEFWNNLEQEKDSISSIPKERWDSEEYYDPDPKAPGKSYSKVGGFIKGIDKFDPLFFNISPAEAVYMDPQQRLFLEEVWKALEDAGCSDRSLSEKKCGVFVGASQGDYVKALTRNNAENSGEAFTGMAVSILASRISYFLNLIGPCITVDTACSSSLSALHLACQSIRNRESDMAVVGGVRLMVTPDLHIATSKVEMLSKAGKCRAFDNSADGTIISEGVGAIILKPLKIALEEGHSIYGVIKSSGINQDGKTNGITAPSMQSQIRLETEVYERGGIDPREISYIETHGTGTKLGDPIEVKALTSVFEKYTAEKQFCIIGSVKSNIGHTTTAAGVTSIIKVLLAMKHKKIPATLHFKEANTHLSLKETPFYVNHKTIDWRVENNKPRLAAISAFGFSGTNAHVVLQEFNAGNLQKVTQEYPYYLITLSAKTRESYDQKVEDLLNWLENLEDNSNIGNIAYTLQVGRSHFNIRGAFVVKNSSDLKAKLKELAVTGQTADYFMEANNSKPVKADANTKVLISTIFEKLQDSINPDHKEYKDNLIELARLYVQNKVTGCESIYRGRKYKLLHLPTYPFFGDRYWIEDDGDLNKEANVEVNAVTNREVNTPTYLFEQVKHISKETEKTDKFLHPMIDRKLSATEETAYEKSFQGTEFFLKDHIVQNEKVLPAVAYLEIARAAGSLSPNKKVIKIKNNYWINALKVKDPFQKIKINLFPDKTAGNVMEYEVVSQEQNEQEVLHGKGQIEYTALSQEGLNEYLDLNTIKSRCPSLITGLECYQLFIKGGLKLGKSFQSIQKMYYNENEVLASIQLPEHLKGDFHEFLLHPTIMDGALEAVIGMVSAKARNGGVTLPYYIGEVEILGELTENCFSYARYTGRKKNGLQESDSYEVFILDEEGKVLVKVKDFSLWTIGAKANEIQSVANEVHYYRYIWENSDIHLPENYLEALESDLLVFDTDNSLSDNLSKRLAGKYNIILVKPGADYVEDSNEFTIAPANKENYVRLIKSLKQKGYVPGNIVYLWSKEPDYEFESVLMQDPEYTIYPLMYLYQALESLMPEERIKLIYMFQGDGKVFSPFSAAYGGFAKSLRLENTKYISKSIQFHAAFSFEEISNLMILELLDATKEDIEILHTPEGRFVRTIQEYLIEEHNLQKETETAESSILGKADFNTKGIYLISGGFGKLGLIVARFLAKDYQAKLCLTSRSPLDEEKVTQIKELEALGSEVLFVQGDVSVLNDAAVIIEAVKEKYGRVNGVIHCAGMTKDAYLKEKRKDDMEQVIIPKVQGTINLDLLTKDEPLDFTILFSSTAAVTGNLGQTDYAYGNCFMDYFSRLRNGLGKRGLRYGTTLSVNWPLWKEGGIQVDKSTEDLFDSLGIKSLETTYGIQSLKDALKSGEDQLVVLQGDTQKLRKLLGLKDKAGKVNFKPNNISNNTHGNIQNNTQSTPQNNPLNNSLINIYKTDLLEDIHQDVKQAVKEILRIKEKDIFLEKDMNEYGFHSLTFTELANKINHLYSIQINPSIFFEYATLGALSDYLYKEHYDSIFAVHGKEETRQITQEAPVIIASLEDDFSNTPAGKREPIAIIGMGGVMPQSEDLFSFWSNLEEARDLVTEIPSDRWKKEDLPANISKWGGFMKEIDKFDPLFFGISPMEAELMDPQQRIFMQTVWETIEDAGYKPSDLAGSNTGLFVGVSTTDYRDVLKDSEIEALTSTGNSHCILTNRISFLLNLHGPSEPIDTACSSSLVAIHRGVESIYSGDCDMAIVGGVNVIASPTLHISFSKAGMLSPDGRCKTFDEKANGYVRGEGTGAILLKPLSKALKDGDNIYALIKGTAINHGGRAASLTAPNTNAQAEVIMKAFDKAGFDPETVSYIEAHGTGTQLGDPVEVNGLIKAFKEMGKKDNNTAAEKEAYCGIGSVKTNIGHLETAAGIASVLKVLLAFKYKTIPGVTNFSVQNPYIQLAGSPFYIAKKAKEWKILTDDYGIEIPRRAGVSSFGFGGVNAHIALEAFEEKVKDKDSMDTTHIFILSARNKDRLSAYALKMLSFLKRETANNNETLNNRALTDFAYTLQAGREEMEERLAIVFSDYKELIHKLADYLQDKEEINGLYRNRVESGKGKAGLKESYTDAATLITLIQKGEFMKLASLWVSGAKIDWKLLYGDKQLKRIPLPTYPFEKRRVWKTANKINTAKELQNESVKEKNSPTSSSPVSTSSASQYRAEPKASIPYVEESSLTENSLTEENKESETAIENCFYLPVWKPVPLPEKISTSRNSLGDNKVLILVPTNYAEMSRQLMDYYDNDEVYVIFLGSENRRIGMNSWEINASNENGISDCLARIDRLDYVYFLGGITSEDTDFNKPESLEITQEMGVLSLFRLIKAFAKKELDNQKLHIKIITNNVHTLGEDDVIPCAGSILGFAKSMAKEFQYWQTTCIDIDLKEWEKDKEYLTGLVIEEPAGRNGEEVVIRNRQRYLHRIVPTGMGKAESTSFRKDGVYLILGGAGGIGLEFCRYLTLKAGAKVALVGRSELDTDRNKKISDMKASGAKILYVKADATDLNSMKEAVLEVKREFGSINGVIHSAIVMKDRAIRNMSERDLLDSLEPKVTGSIVLYEAVKEENLDFIMFFSSIQSFVGNGGQANYAAACGFKDSFALHLMKSGKIPVKIINWGYWGSVGVASSKEHNKIMASKGMLSIQPEEGMEAIERIVSDKAASQVIVLKAKPFLLKQTDIVDNANWDAVLENGTEQVKTLVAESKQTEEETQAIVSTPLEVSFKGYFDNRMNYKDILSNLKSRIIRCIAEVLKVETGEVDNSTSFSDYGVDSITGMELIDRINNEFELTLKTTILFDYSNVDDLAAYIEKEIVQETENQIRSNSGWNTDSHEDMDLYQIVSEKLIECITETLKVNREDIDFTMQFSEFGVDSITGVSLLQNINEAFGIVLKNTVLFDYSNIKDLSEYLCREYGMEMEAALTYVSDSFEDRVVSEVDPLELLAKGILNVDDVMEMITGMSAETPA
jgi:polyketide synthase PksN